MGCIDLHYTWFGLCADVFSPTNPARASISSISSPRACTHKNYNAFVPCIPPSDQQLKAKEPIVENSEEYVVGEVSKNGGTLFLASKDADSVLKSDDPQNEVKKPVFLDEISIVCVDESGKENETGVLDNCGLLPNNCLPCLASAVSSVDKRRSLSPSHPIARRKPSLKLSFKRREGHATPPLCESHLPFLSLMPSSIFIYFPLFLYTTISVTFGSVVINFLIQLLIDERDIG